MARVTEEEVVAIARRIEEEVVIPISEEALDEVENAYGFAVVAKVGGGEALGKEGFASLLKRLWKPSEGTEFRTIADDLMVVVFAKKEEKERVLRGGPWMCNEWPILVDELKPDTSATEVRLSTFNIWVQIHNLPWGYTRGRPLRDIAEAIGGVIIIQEPTPPKRGLVTPVKYVRMLVKADLDVPVKHGFFVPRRSDVPFWVDLKYERMPAFCYKCGKWSHEEDKCKEMVDRSAGRYGPWLRADFGGSGVLSRERDGSSVGLSVGSQQDAGSTGEGAMKEVSAGGNLDGRQRKKQVGGELVLDSRREVSVDNFREVEEGAENDLGRDQGIHCVIGDGCENSGDKRGKGKVGEEITSMGASLLTDVNVAYADQLQMGGADLGNPPGFNVVEVCPGNQVFWNVVSSGGEQGVERVKKKKDVRLLGLRSERNRFKMVKPKTSNKKVMEQVRMELNQVGAARGEGDVVSTVELSVEAAEEAQPRREP